MSEYFFDPGAPRSMHLKKFLTGPPAKRNPLKALFIASKSVRLFQCYDGVMSHAQERQYFGKSVIEVKPSEMPQGICRTAAQDQGPNKEPISCRSRSSFPPLPPGTETLCAHSIETRLDGSASNDA
jgi:hypothetical protein